MASGSPTLNYSRQDWRPNKITTAERAALSANLTTSNKFLTVYDTDLQSLYVWDGSAWQPHDPFAIGGGGTGEAIIKTFIAGETIGGGMAVMYTAGKIFKFVASNSANYGKLVGISNQSAILNGSIDVVLEGICSQSGGLTPNSIYYASGTPGLLSTTQPSTGISQIVGIAIDSTTILVQLQKPYIKI